ncbi:MAG: ATP-binding protein, partial [Chthoniobacteraceae bacterium]
WQRYRAWIIGTVTVILAEAVLIAALIANLLRRRRAERSLSESETRVALAAEAARLGAWELDTATGRMWVSDKVRELFNLEPEEAVDLATFENRVLPEDRAARAAEIEGAIQGWGEYQAEYRVLLPDKTVRWISGRGRRMNAANGKPPRLFGVAMDITERKEAISGRQRAEEEARRQREQIDLLGRASLLGEMTASLAHELNQPLAAIVANASAGVRFIDGGEIEPDALREIFADVGSDGRRARGIIQSVRNAIKKGDSVRGRISINRVVKNVALMVRPDAAGHSCEVATSLAENLPRIEADPIQMQQVLVNLVTNAFHAMSETPIALRKVEIRTLLDGAGSVHVTVRDHGTGISAETQEQIFEHFYTTRKDGLGMGLAIVRSIIEAHGGKINAGNVEGGGACFDVRLPAIAKSDE